MNDEKPTNEHLIMRDSTIFRYLLVIFGLSVNTATCNSNQWCYEKCLEENVVRSSSSNIDIYLEYKKAVIKVPAPPKIKTNSLITMPSGDILQGMLNNPQRTKLFWKRKSRGIIAKKDDGECWLN